MQPANPSRLLIWISPLIYLSNNTLSLAGVVLVTTGAVSWFFLLPTLWRAPYDNPYLGILWMGILGVFVTGLILIPAGIHLKRVRLRRQGRPMSEAFPPLALGSPELRRLAGFLAVTTFANVLIAGQLTYTAINYMESQTFCGAACHSVMSPEYTAFKLGPHSRLECIRCHAGPGATGFVRAKLAGVHQVAALTFHNYSRPIPTPVRNMLPANETCGNCHSLRGQPENAVRVLTKFNDDQQNTPTNSVLLIHLGAIHGAHMGENTVRYAADEKREKISWVERSSAGKRTVFAAEGAPANPPDDLRTMDCLDCHSRPAHTFELPERAIDRALAGGKLPSLPFMKKWGLEILNTTPAAQIPAALAAHYQQTQPQADIDRAAAALVSIYNSNVFPQMKIGWGTYANQLGHTDAPGCFRCHDEAHTSPGGAKITQDCGVCHNLVAIDDPSPKVLGDLGITH
jgi:hypothetical protein